MSREVRNEMSSEETSTLRGPLGCEAEVGSWVEAWVLRFREWEMRASALATLPIMAWERAIERFLESVSTFPDHVNDARYLIKLTTKP